MLGRHARPGLTSRVEVCPQQTPLRRCTVSLSYRFTLLSILLLFHLTLPLVPVSLVPFSSDVQTARKSLHYPSLSLLSFHPTILSVAAPLPTSIKSLKVSEILSAVPCRALTDISLPLTALPLPPPSPELLTVGPFRHQRAARFVAD